MSYEVMCVCGQLQRGARRRQFQVVPCANCGRKLFVLPRSPRDGSEELSDPSAVGAPARSRLRWWGVPLLVGAASIAVVVAAFLTARPHLQRKQAETETPAAEDKALWGKAEAARRLMGQGKFHLAREAFAEVMRQRAVQPQLLVPAQNRQLNQWQRQAALLSRLSAMSLEQIARLGTLARDPTEWRAQFEEDFRGRSVVFDSVVRLDGEGRPVLDYLVEVKGQDAPVRLALEDLEELRDLPLDESPRLIFGARLAGCDREGEGKLVIRFAADSGVLLTDADAVEAASARSLDPGLKDTLALQQRWLDERRAVVPPGRP